MGHAESFVIQVVCLYRHLTVVKTDIVKWNCSPASSSVDCILFLFRRKDILIKKQKNWYSKDVFTGEGVILRAEWHHGTHSLRRQMDVEDDKAVLFEMASPQCS